MRIEFGLSLTIGVESDDKIRKTLKLALSLSSSLILLPERRFIESVFLNESSRFNDDSTRGAFELVNEILERIQINIHEDSVPTTRNFWLDQSARWTEVLIFLLEVTQILTAAESAFTIGELDSAKRARLVKSGEAILSSLQKVKEQNDAR